MSPELAFAVKLSIRMRNKALTGLGLACSAAVILISAATSAQSFNDDFESYTLGSNLHGQGGWTGWDGNSAAGAVVSSAAAFSGSQSVDIVGASDLVHTFVDVTSGLWTLSVQQYVPSSSSGTSQLVLWNSYPSPGAWKDASVQIRYNLTAGWVTSDFDSSPTPNALAILKDQWVESRFEINLNDNLVTEYYNNQLLYSHPWQTAGLDQLQALDLYANSAGSVYYDNVVLIPEPTTASLLVLGGLAMLLRRSRSRA